MIERMVSAISAGELGFMVYEWICSTERCVYHYTVRTRCISMHATLAEARASGSLDMDYFSI
jgi:hypothetical protein